MAKTHKAPFGQSAFTAQQRIAAAIGSLDSTAPTGVTLLTDGGAEGRVVTGARVVPLAAHAAGYALLLIRAAGTSVTLPVAVASFTANGFTGGPSPAAFDLGADVIISEDTPLRLGAEDSLYGGLSISGVGFSFALEGMDYADLEA